MAPRPRQIRGPLWLHPHLAAALKSAKFGRLWRPANAVIAPGEPTRPPAHAAIWITRVSSDRRPLAVHERHWRRSDLTRGIRLQRGHQGLHARALHPATELGHRGQLRGRYNLLLRFRSHARHKGRSCQTVHRYILTICASVYRGRRPERGTRPSAERSARLNARQTVHTCSL